MRPVQRLVARSGQGIHEGVMCRMRPPSNTPCPLKQGTDCVGHITKATTDANPNMTIFNVDGIGAYDHVLQSAMLWRFHSCQRHDRMSCVQPSSCQWIDAGGEEQGGLMPCVPHRDPWCFLKWQQRCSLVNNCAHSWMMCTSCATNHERKCCDLLEEALLRGRKHPVAPRKPS